jgi:PAS domain S-box-containing protein
MVSQAVKLGASEYIVKNPGYLYKLPAIIENAFHRMELIREQAALREAENRYRVLVEQSPAATYIDAIDDSSSSLFISKRIEEICGYPINEWRANKDFWISILHPDDLDKVMTEHERTNLSLDPFRMEYRVIAQDGRVIWLRDEAIIVYNEDGKPQHWQGLLINITDQKNAEEALRRRDAIMEAISIAAEKFLVVSWRENIQSVLEQLGIAANLSRAYIFQNRIANEKTLIDQIYEWTAPGISPQINNPELAGFDLTQVGFDRWIPLMSTGQPIFGRVREMGEGEQAVFAPQGIQSMACMPIFVNKEWWGFIGFDDCKEERIWHSAEIDALRTSANILGAAIQRLNSEFALQRQLNELSVLQAISAAGMKSTQIDELISLTTQTLSNLLYPDNCGVFILNESTHELVAHRSYHGLSGNLQPTPIKVGHGVVGNVFLVNAPILVADVNSFPGYISFHPDIKSEMAVPLIIGDRVFGVLNVESRQLANYSTDDLRLLTTIAGQLSTAMEKIRLLENEHRRLQE